MWRHKSSNKVKVRQILWIYAVISLSNSTEILLNSYSERIRLGTAGFPRVSLLKNLPHIFVFSLSSVFLSPSASLSFPLLEYFQSASFLFLSLPDSASFFLLLFFSSVQLSLIFSPCQPTPDVLSINTSSSCKRYCVQVWCAACLTQKWVRVCKKVRKTVSVKIKGSINVSQIMCMHVTVSSFHLWLSASPHTSLGKLCRSHC